MEFELITREDLRELRQQMMEEIRQHFAAQPAREGEWLKSSQVRKMLSISPGTLQNLRVTGALKFTKIGGSFYYERRAIEDLLKSDKMK